MEYTLDNDAHWYPARASDGTFDEQTEDFNFTTAVLSDGNYTVKVRATDIADNTADPANYATDTFTIDTIRPTNPVVRTPSYVLSTWSFDNTIDVTWSGATDGLSGVEGYSYEWSTSPTTVPDTQKECEENVNSTTSSPRSDSNSWYFHIRTRDNAGNWAGAVHLGPFKVDNINPTVDIANPFDGSAVAATASIAVNEADNVGVL